MTGTLLVGGAPATDARPAISARRAIRPYRNACVRCIESVPVYTRCTLAPSVARSSFRSGVGEVVGLRAKEQMTRPNAYSVVASVKHKQSLGDRAAFHLPSYAVREGRYAVLSPFSPDRGGSVAARRDRPLPFPALTRLVYVRPELDGCVTTGVFSHGIV